MIQSSSSHSYPSGRAATRAPPLARAFGRFPNKDTMDHGDWYIIGSSHAQIVAVRVPLGGGSGALGLEFCFGWYGATRIDATHC